MSYRRKRQTTISSHILVTGGSGFIGSSFIRYLLASELQFEGKVVNVDLLTYAASRENLSQVEDDERYFFYKEDICDKKQIALICKKHKIDTIVHFAAETHVDNSIANPSPFIEANIIGTFSLLEVLRQYRLPIHFHHISTDEVYGSLGDNGFFHEESIYQPNSPYSASKAASDHLTRAYAKTYELSITLSHCTNNYGPCQHREKFIPTIIHSCLQRDCIPIYGQGENKRDWLYVDDHADAIWKMLTLGAAGQTYDVGMGSEISNMDLVYLVIERLAKALQCEESIFYSLITFVPDRPGHDYRYAINPAKIQKQLNWRCMYTMQEGVDKTLQWYLASQKEKLPVKI